MFIWQYLTFYRELSLQCSDLFPLNQVFPDKKKSKPTISVTDEVNVEIHREIILRVCTSLWRSPERGRWPARFGRAHRWSLSLDTNCSWKHGNWQTWSPWTRREPVFHQSPGGWGGDKEGKSKQGRREKKEMVNNSKHQTLTYGTTLAVSNISTILKCCLAYILFVSCFTRLQFIVSTG